MKSKKNTCSSLKRQRSTNEGRQKSTQQSIDDIDAQIERLQRAYNTINDAIYGVRGDKSCINSLHVDYNSVWKGNNADYVNNACEDGGYLSEDYKVYIDKIDDIQDSINNKIYELKQTQSEKYGILQGLINAWYDLTARIENYTN